MVIFRAPQSHPPSLGILGGGGSKNSEKMDFFKLADMITPTLGVEKHHTSDVITLPKRLYRYSKGARGKLIFW